VALRIRYFPYGSCLAAFALGYTGTFPRINMNSDILCAFDYARSYARSDVLIGREIDILSRENDILFN
jgi:hypothetical protein